MKKLLVFGLAVLMLLSLGTMVNAKTLKLGLDAGPVSQDPQVQLSGGMLQYSHWALTPWCAMLRICILNPGWR